MVQDPQARPASAKRRLLDGIEATKPKKKSKTGRKRRPVALKKDQIDAFLSAGRCVSRVLSPYLELESVIEAGMVKRGIWEGDAIDETDDDEYDDYLVSLEAFRKLESAIPDFIAVLSEFNDREEMEPVLARMLTADQTSRHADTRKVKNAIRLHVESNHKKNVPGFENGFVPEDKIARGYNHQFCGRMMTEYRLVKIFDEDPKAFCDSMNGKTRSRKLQGLPTFFYNNEGKAGFGELIFQATEEVLFGSSKSYRHNISTKTTTGDLHNINEITAEFFAYCCSLVYFALSALPSLGPKDEDFYYYDFFTLIVNYFEYNPKFAQETLDFYNQKYCGPARKRKGRNTTGPLAEEAVDPDSDLAAINAAKEAKRAQRRADRLRVPPAGTS